MAPNFKLSGQTFRGFDAHLAITRSLGEEPV